MDQIGGHVEVFASVSHAPDLRSGNQHDDEQQVACQQGQPEITIRFGGEAHRR